MVLWILKKPKTCSHNGENVRQWNVISSTFRVWTLLFRLDIFWINVAVEHVEWPCYGFSPQSWGHLTDADWRGTNPPNHPPAAWPTPMRLNAYLHEQRSDRCQRISIWTVVNTWRRTRARWRSELHHTWAVGNNSLPVNFHALRLPTHHRRTLKTPCIRHIIEAGL